MILKIFAEDLEQRRSGGDTVDAPLLAVEHEREAHGWATISGEVLQQSRFFDVAIERRLHEVVDRQEADPDAKAAFADLFHVADHRGDRGRLAGLGDHQRDADRLADVERGAQLEADAAAGEVAAHDDVARAQAHDDPLEDHARRATSLDGHDRMPYMLWLLLEQLPLG